ncbi:MAG: HNH endonuclease [Ktedonobacteraceae bacterium]|nr:HNH endonuclease [Ktedonobacteraceae bacterium]
MNNALLLPIIVVLVVLLIGYILLAPRRRRHQAIHHHTKRRVVKNLLKRVDHGARVAIEHGHQRSPLWPGVADAHLLREPSCVVCGYRGRHVQVHHVKPFHLHPNLELDPNNLITLCEAGGREHHLILGHLDSWQSYNEHVRADAKHYYRKTAAQIRDDLRWRKMMVERP